MKTLIIEFFCIFSFFNHLYNCYYTDDIFSFKNNINIPKITLFNTKISEVIDTNYQLPRL